MALVAGALGEKSLSPVPVISPAEYARSTSALNQSEAATSSNGPAKLTLTVTASSGMEK